MSDFWTDADVISRYTRAQAIEDGVLTTTEQLVPDEPDFAKQAGFKVPVAMTAAIVDLVTPSVAERGAGQDLKGRLWDVLWMAMAHGRRHGGSELLYPVIFWMDRDGAQQQVTMKLKAVIGPGDNAESVLTIMLPEED